MQHVEEPGEPEELDEPDDEPTERRPEPSHHTGALMLGFGSVYPGREALAVGTFTEVSRTLGNLLADRVISRFTPYFFADGQVAGMSGFFLIEGDRERLDALRHDEDFRRLLLRTGAATANVQTRSLIAGTEAGRLVNLHREVRTELGLLGTAGATDTDPRR